MSTTNIEAQEALAGAKFEGLKKKLNAASWSDHMEDLMKNWGEKAAGLRFIHSHAAGYWRGLSNKLTILGIGVTTVASTVALTTASLEESTGKNVIIYVVGGIGIVATFVQSLKKFYNSEE